MIEMTKEMRDLRKDIRAHRATCVRVFPISIRDRAVTILLQFPQTEQWSVARMMDIPNPTAQDWLRKGVSARGVTWKVG